MPEKKKKTVKITICQFNWGKVVFCLLIILVAFIIGYEGTLLSDTYKFQKALLLILGVLFGIVAAFTIALSYNAFLVEAEPVEEEECTSMLGKLR